MSETDKSHRAQAKWNQCINKFKTWLEEHKTRHDIVCQLIQGLHEWHDDTLSCRNWNETLLADQDIIGWNRVHEGLFGFHWGISQDNCFKLRGSLKSGTKWQSQVIHRIWQIAWDMW